MIRLSRNRMTITFRSAQFLKVPLGNEPLYVSLADVELAVLRQVDGPG